jgi:uncharacterized iron-regulated protein
MPDTFTGKVTKAFEEKFQENIYDKSIYCKEHQTKASFHEVESFLIQALTEQRESVVKMLKMKKGSCHFENKQRGCVDCVIQENFNEHIDDLLSSLAIN